MKYFLTIILFFFIGIVLGVVTVAMVNKKNTDISLTTPLGEEKTEEFSVAQAPKESVRGNIVSMTGTIEWENRTATEPAKLVSPVTIQQGEKLLTETNGNIKISFPYYGKLTVFPDSDVDIIQTLPVDFVFGQTKGKAEYEATANTPFSIRSLRLLTTMKNGLLDISIDEETHFVTVTVKKGEVRVAYNDTDFVSTILTVPEGHKFVFDSDNRDGILR